MSAHLKMVSRDRDLRKKDFVLPNDVMFLIFLQFSVKELSQFRCVCKAWNRIINSRPFFESLSKQSSGTCILYHPCFTRLNLGLYSESLQNFVEYSVSPFGSQLKDFGILGSCNGVLCLYNIGFDRSLIYMCNPAIRKCRTLPRPFYNPRYLGFGVNPKSGYLDDFKVVSICTKANAEVYSLRTNSWKIIAGGFLPSIDIICCHIDHPVFLNGCVHWCARVSCYCDSKCPWLIVSFDFANEVFQKIMLPDELSKGGGTRLLNDVNGRLCLFSTVNEDPHVYELWVMMEYGVVESWTKTCVIEKRQQCWWPLGFTASGSILIRGYCKHGEDTLLWYKPERKKFKCVGKHVPHLPVQSVTFAESLISPMPQPVIIGTI